MISNWTTATRATYLRNVRNGKWKPAHDYQDHDTERLVYQMTKKRGCDNYVGRALWVSIEMTPAESERAAQQDGAAALLAHLKKLKPTIGE